MRRNKAEENRRRKMKIRITNITGKNIGAVITVMLMMIICGKSSIAQNTQDVRYTALPGSRMWIEGTSTLDDFKCTTADVNGYAEISEPENPLDTAAADTVKDKDVVYVSVLVHSLDCGKKLMNKDMYNAMKSDKFPAIKYELLSAHIKTSPDSTTGWFNLMTKGNLYIAGEHKTVDILMRVKELADGRFRLLGSKPLSMLDFGITPPSHFFGLIKAHKDLTVHFDLLAERVTPGGLHSADILGR